MVFFLSLLYKIYIIPNAHHPLLPNPDFSLTLNLSFLNLPDLLQGSMLKNKLPMFTEFKKYITKEVHKRNLKVINITSLIWSGMKSSHSSEKNKSCLLSFWSSRYVNWYIISRKASLNQLVRLGYALSTISIMKKSHWNIFLKYLLSHFCNLRRSTAHNNGLPSSRPASPSAMMYYPVASILLVHCQRNLFIWKY